MKKLIYSIKCLFAYISHHIVDGLKSEEVITRSIDKGRHWYKGQIHGLIQSMINCAEIEVRDFIDLDPELPYTPEYVAGSQAIDTETSTAKKDVNIWLVSDSDSIVAMRNRATGRIGYLVLLRRDKNAPISDDIYWVLLKTAYQYRDDLFVDSTAERLLAVESLMDNITRPWYHTVVTTLTTRFVTFDDMVANHMDDMCVSYHMVRSSDYMSLYYHQNKAFMFYDTSGLAKSVHRSGEELAKVSNVDIVGKVCINYDVHNAQTIARFLAKKFK